MEYVKTNVIIDTDIGEDIDDTWALTFLLSSQFVDVKMICVSTGDVNYKARIVAKILTLLNMTHIPICLGVKSDIEDYNQLEWVNDFSLDVYKGQVLTNAKEAFKNIINQTENLSILEIAPMSTLFSIFNLINNPKIKIVAMGGSIYKGYFETKNPSIECNVFRDINAARNILSSKAKVTLVPLDVCYNYIVEGNAYQQILKSKSIRSKIIVENYKIWAKKYIGNVNYFDPNKSSSILYDLVATFVLMFPQYFDYFNLTVSVTDKGETVISGNNIVSVALNSHKLHLLFNVVAERFNTTFEVNQEIQRLAIPKMYSLTYALQATNSSLSVAEVGWEQRRPGSNFGPMERELYIMHAVEEGAGVITVEGIDYKFKKGDIFLVPPHKQVSYSADKDNPCLYHWVAYSGAMAKELTIKAGFLLNNKYVITPTNIDAIIKRLKLMNSISSNDSGIPYFLLGNLYIIFSSLFTTAEFYQSDEKNYVKKAIEFIEQHYDEDIKIDDLARYVALDRTYIYRLFKNKTGLSIKDYLTNIRIDQAKKMLQSTNQPINSIMLSVGYTNYLSFFNIFKSKTGLTPNNYRKSHKTTKI